MKPWLRRSVEFLGVPTSKASVKKRLAAGAIAGTGSALAGAGGGGVAASVDPYADKGPWGDWNVISHTPARGGGSPGGSGGGFSLGSLLGVGKLGVDAFTGIWGAKNATKTAKYQTDITAKGIQDQLALERTRLADEKAQFDVTQAELKRQWEAEQAFRAQQFAVSEEERIWRRKLEDEREARAGRRRADSLAARAKLRSLLGLD